MKKGKKAVGAPAHVQLFSTMMILLLAFFIVLTSLIKSEDETGFQNNIGDIQNAFGITGGIGMLAHHFSWAPVESSPGTLDAGEVRHAGAATRHTRGDGGVGTNDTTPEKGTPVYLQVPVPYGFEPGSAALTPQLSEYLDIAGTVLASYPSYHYALRQVTTETGDRRADARLAYCRALAVQHYLSRSCALPMVRMTTVGYADWSFLPQVATEDNRDRKQVLVFDLYKPDPK